MSNLELLTPQNCTVIFIDHQPQMLFGVTSIDRQLLINNTVALAKAAKVFNVPTILTSVETKSFSGYIWPQLTEQFPDTAPIERTSMNSWEDPGFKSEVERVGRKKLIIAALWTEVCLTFPALEMVRDGYEVYAVADASGGTSTMAHDIAMQRMIQSGVVPVTWQQVLLEFQRDWARKETYDATLDVVKAHSGAYGSGVEYAYTMVHGAAPSVPTPEPIRVEA
ncbi:hydrolase [Vacuolonema iberomarrocanum]|uniref:hydrolase n=1 Tax=Vacuolonema iberomarrocanum TaxID=3454632 RepID=UPI001A0C9B54|nr:hydrolase [filamentous cyanobacterium LEGE 07170]